MRAKTCPVCKFAYENAEAAFHRCCTNKDGLDYRCKACKAESESALSRQRRDAKRYAKDKSKVLARAAAQQHYAGKKFVCSALNCPEWAVHLHHVDYSEPLAVIPLCEKHHRAEHD